MPPKTPKHTSKTLKSDSVHDAEQQASGDVEAELTSEANASELIPSSALRLMQEDFGRRFDMMLAEIKAVRGDIKLMAARVSLAEDRIGTNEDNIATLKDANSTMKAELDALTRKVEDMENQSRRNNIRLVGLLEKKEGRDICTFLSKWIPEVLGAENFPEPLLIERAHRIGSPRDADSTARPREVIMKFLNFPDKIRVMRAARLKSTVIYEGRRVMFFQDFSVDLRKQRRLFDPIKKQLSTLHIQDLRFGIIYPAKMLITSQGSRRVFDTPSAASLFVQQLKANGQEENST